MARCLGIALGLLITLGTVQASAQSKSAFVTVTATVVPSISTRATTQPADSAARASRANRDPRVEQSLAPHSTSFRKIPLVSVSCPLELCGTREFTDKKDPAPVKTPDPALRKVLVLIPDL
jgi:hypothetical protein